MEVTTEMVKELRDMTGISVMQCKKALVEADGDMEKAKIILEKKQKITLCFGNCLNEIGVSKAVRIVEKIKPDFIISVRK